MKENLVIVESPAKAKTIEKFLGEGYRVMSSYGHIRDLKKRGMGIDTDTFEPQYEIPEDKKKVVTELRRQAKTAQTVWLASDEDREGEAISWHLKEVLGLTDDRTRRIVFHEITKPAILAAIENPRSIDQNLVNAQQARRVLDRVVGFQISPVLWRRVKPSLSAGRVQSVAVRLIVERERAVQAFKGEDYYRVTAVLANAAGQTVKAELNHRFATEDEAAAFLAACRTAQLTVTDVQTRPATRCPSAPFTTSTLQQEAAHQLHFSVAQTMNVAQRLYEAGHITYMRTDSTNLSTLCLSTSRDYITQHMGAQYVKNRQYHTKAKGAQEAHEAIRPTYISHTTINATPQEQKLYDLIWKRTLASQMADARIEKTTATIAVSGQPYTFVAAGEVIKFDGFLSVYMEADPDEGTATRPTEQVELPAMAVGEAMARREVTATQRFAQHPARFNEASLVRKLEELGIGRPSTYAATITTIQQRDYVTKTDRPGTPTPYAVLTLKGDSVKRTVAQMNVGAEKGKLLPTDVGIVVNDFLTESFPDILDYNFTAEVEKKFDEIAEGTADWMAMTRDFYAALLPQIDESMNSHADRRVGERQLGTDPATGMPVLAKIGKFGPVVQIGVAADGVKPRFARLGKAQSIENITLDEALDLFTLPRSLGEYEGGEVTVGAGRYGPYVQLNKKYYSLPKGVDPMDVDMEQAIDIIAAKRVEDENKHMKSFAEEPELEIIKGRYGPYIIYKGQNYYLNKEQRAQAADFTLADCMKIVTEQAPAEKGKRKYTRRR